LSSTETSDQAFSSLDRNDMLNLLPILHHNFLTLPECPNRLKAKGLAPRCASLTHMVSDDPATKTTATRRMIATPPQSAE
jgi:hypothetical protein